MPTRYLAEDEKLLVEIKLQGLQQIEPSAIEPLYQQEPNRTFLGMAPYLSLYYFGKKFYSPPRIDAKIQKQRGKMAAKVREAGADTVRVRKLRNRYNGRIASLQKRKEEGNFVMRLGEPPAIYDSLLMAETMDQISIFLNANGYFNHEAYFEKDTTEHLAHITIYINENEPYRYSQRSYTIPDTAVLNLVKRTEQRSLIQTGAIYNEDVLADERDRLYEVMRNNGYYDFVRAYTSFEVDTSYGENSVRIHTIIQNPENEPRHHVYTIKDVYFKTDVDRFGIPRDTLLYNDIHYIAYKFRYSPKILDLKADIYPGQEYSALRTSTTQRKLADLDVFQFNNVNYTRVTQEADSLINPYQLRAHINALPTKRFQETTEIGLNYTVRRPGPFSSIRLRMRNVLGGAENLDFGLRGGLEAQLNIANQSNETVMIKEFGGDMSLTFPVILLPGSRALLSDNNPRTRIYTGYTLIDRQEFKRYNYDFSLDYIWQKSRRPLQAPILQYVFSPLNLTVVESNLSEEFEEQLKNINYRSFEESFRSGIISSMSFNVIYNTNDIAQTRNARYFRTTFEVGGLSKELGVDIGFNDLQTFQFARINPDYRRYVPLGGKRYFAYRINTGIASPIFQSSVLPYERYFFTGGTNSMRAWQFRRLGPGSYAEYVTNENGDRIRVNSEQPGEVILEASAEYRFNIFSFLNGALFADAGNIWMLKPNPERVGADFQFDRFYKEIAVGTGFGLRFDLSVLVLRFDFATKVYEPSGINGKKFVLGDFKFSDFFRQSNQSLEINQSTLNIGIGYPF